MELVYKLVIFIIWRVQTIHMASFTDVQTLYTHLTTGRNKYFRPQIDYDQVTDVTISFTLSTLQDINAVEGTISIAGYFTVLWKDEHLVWTPGDYNNIELMTLPHDQIWKPPLINSNSANEMKVFLQDNTFVQLYYNGSVMWLPGQTLKFICDIDTTYFPFNTQECQFLIISWGFPMGKITFTPMDKTINTASFRINSEWDLTGTSVSVDNSQIYTDIYTTTSIPFDNSYTTNRLHGLTEHLCLLSATTFRRKDRICSHPVTGCSGVYDYSPEFTARYSYATTVSHLYHSHD